MNTKLDSSGKIPDSHLQSPIRPDIRIFLTEDCRIPYYLQRLKRKIPPEVHIDKKSKDSEWAYGMFLSGIFNSDLVLRWVKTHIPETLGGIQHHMEGLLRGMGIPRGSMKSLTYTLSKDDLQMISQKIIWEDLRRQMQIEKTRGTDNWVDSKILPYGVNRLFYSGVAIFARVRSSWIILDYDQVMMISDTIAGRVLTLIYHDMLEDHIPGKIERELFESVYSIFDHLLLESGNNSYKTIKKWESLVLSILLHTYDPLSCDQDLYSWVKKEIEEDQDESAEAMMILIESKGLTSSQLSELHGIYRHWGHPTVDEVAGCRKVKNFASNRPLPNFKVMNDMLGLLNRQFCISFMRRHGRWPAIKMTPEIKKTVLGKAILNHSTTLNLYSHKLSIGDWAKLEFEKEFDFDYFLDFTEISDDKSLSVKRSEIRTIYNRDLLGYNPGHPTTHRRLLLEMLSRPEIDIKEICDIIQWGDIPEEWKIIILHAKEREEKPDPRLFAMAVFEIRSYLCVTESNLSSTIFEYFPQQTMTMGEADLSKRLYTMTQSQEDKNFLPVIISIDFKSWNLHWSRFSTELFFRQIDNLFGTPLLYERTHQLFASMLVALASHNNPPDFYVNNQYNDDIPDDDPRVWTNHQGGFEGLRQKGWTLITICMLLYVELLTGLKSVIVGQGDNQVVKLLIPLEETGLSKECYIVKYKDNILKKVNQYLDALSKTAQDIGLEVKKEETFFATSIMIYGKDIICEGAFFSSASKKVARLLTDINEIMPTVYDEISTLQSAGLATAQKGHDIIVPYILAQLETLCAVSRDIDWSLVAAERGKGEDIKWFSNQSSKMFLIHLSADFGSCPIQPWLSFLYRGHPDTLTAYLTTLWLGAPYCDMCKRLYVYLQDSVLERGDADPELLILNPNSLNLKRSIPPVSIYRAMLEKQLPGITKNTHLREIFCEEKFEADKELVNYMIQCKPLFPRFLHEIFRVTEAGTRISFIAKFSNSRTTQLLLTQGNSYKNLRSRVGKIERQLIQDWRELYVNLMALDVADSKYTDLMDTCPTRLANDLRSYSWYPLTRGREIVGTTLPHPAHQFVMQSSTRPIKDNNPGMILYKPLAFDAGTLLSTRGPYTPYIGSKTKEKVSGKVMVLPRAYRPVQSAKRAVLLDQWIVSPISRLHEFIVSLVASRTNIDEKILQFCSGSVSSGSPIHRLDDHVTKRQTLSNYRPNVSTHIYMSTDTMGRYSRGQFNYNIHFQGALHYGLSYVQLLLLYKNPQISPYYHLLFLNDDCLEELPSILVSNEEEYPILLSSPQNPLLYTSLDIDKLICHPKNQFYNMVSRSRDDNAAAFILVNNLIKNLNSSEWGITESSHSRMSKISIQDIIRIGIENLLQALTRVLLLMFDMKNVYFTPFLLTVGSHAWVDLVQICLLPEILKDLGSICNISHANLFTNHYQIATLLSRAISIIYRQNRDTLPQFFASSRPTFFVGEHLGLKRVLTMWAKYIKIVTEDEFDIVDEIKRLSRGITLMSNLPSSDICLQIYQIVYNKYKSAGVKCFFDTYRLNISKVPPESLLRISKFIYERPQKAILLAEPGTLTLLRELRTWCVLYNISLQAEVFYIINVDYPARLQILAQKDYSDHKYHLYGYPSCSFIKIIQVLLTNDFSVEGKVICVGDGEGGVSRALLEVGASLVYFNTLIDVSSLIPHRAVSYIPSALIGMEDKVNLTELSALTGGDLLDDIFIDQFISAIKGPINLLTNDAELSTRKPIAILTLHKNVLKIINKCKPEKVVSKLYIDDPAVASDVVAMYHVFYRSVTLNIPVQSSHEHYETYIACTDFRDTIDNYDNNSFLGYGSQHHYYELLQEIRRCRIYEDPLMTSFNCSVEHLLSLYQPFSASSTLSHSIEKLWGFSGVFLSSEDWHTQLQDQKTILYDLLVEEAVSAGKSQGGFKISMLGSALLSQGITTHSIIEKMCINYLNAELLIDLFENIENDPKEILNGFIRSSHEIKIHGVRYYTVCPADIGWNKSYLKSYWVCVGHFLFKQMPGYRL